MLRLDSKVQLTCETDKMAPGTIVRIQGNRVDVVLDQVDCECRFMKRLGFMGNQSGLNL